MTELSKEAEVLLERIKNAGGTKWIPEVDWHIARELIDARLITLHNLTNPIWKEARIA